MRNLFLIVSFVALLFIYTGCASEPQKDLDYEQTKKMIIDILQTDEGKRALLDIISDDKLKQHLVIESDVVRETISETLLSKNGKDMWKELFADPKFIDSFYTSIADEQEKMLKHLMKDADFQKQMLDLLQNPEMAEQTIKLLKSQQFRKHLENTIIETIDNPIYRAKLQKELEEKTSKEEDEEDSKKEDEENDEEKEDKEESKADDGSDSTDS